MTYGTYVHYYSLSGKTETAKKLVRSLTDR